MSERWVKGAFCDNAVVHFWPNSPYIAKCSVNLRMGKKIVFRAVLRDTVAAANFLEGIPVPVRTIVHN